MPKTYEPIATHTVSGSAVASYTFSTIPQTFTDIVVVGSVKLTTSSNSTVKFRVNSDTGSNYSYTYVQGNGSTTESGRQTSVTSGQFSAGGFAITEAADTFNPLIMNCQNYSNTTTNKTFLHRGNNSAAGTGLAISLWRNTIAVTSITIFPAAGNLDIGTTLTLYGIKAN